MEQLFSEGVLKSLGVREALLKVPREEFVWPNTKRESYADSPLPLGDTGQTISAPHMVAIMLEELELNRGQVVLEIGAGSGYNAALMAEMVGRLPGGRKPIITIERSEKLADFAKANLERTGYSDRIDVITGDGTLGYPEKSQQPLYDRITVTAAAPYVPRYLRLQLKPEGILLIPVGDLWMQTLVKAKKLPDGTLKSRDVCGCMFVPLVGENGH